MSNKSKEEILKVLESVTDPEIPVLNVVEMGVVRDVKAGEEVIVVITPTYSGCPAMDVIASDIRSRLEEAGITDVKVETQLSPPWTTDWLTDEAKKKLEDFGIAPPAVTTADKKALMGQQETVKCPYCGSTNTVMKSAFGSTACKAFYQCNDCKEPFDYFKCL